MELRARAERGVLWARMSWVTVRDLVEKRRTSPVGCWEEEGAPDEVEEVEFVVESGVGVGRGDG